MNLLIVLFIIKFYLKAITFGLKMSIKFCINFKYKNNLINNIYIFKKIINHIVHTNIYYFRFMFFFRQHFFSWMSQHIIRILYLLYIFLISLQNKFNIHLYYSRSCITINIICNNLFFVVYYNVPLVAIFVGNYSYKYVMMFISTLVLQLPM